MVVTLFALVFFSSSEDGARLQSQAVAQGQVLAGALHRLLEVSAPALCRALGGSISLGKLLWSAWYPSSYASMFSSAWVSSKKSLQLVML